MPLLNQKPFGIVSKCPESADYLSASFDAANKMLEEAFLCAAADPGKKDLLYFASINKHPADTQDNALSSRAATLLWKSIETDFSNLLRDRYCFTSNVDGVIISEKNMDKYEAFISALMDNAAEYCRETCKSLISSKHKEYYSEFSEIANNYFTRKQRDIADAMLNLYYSIEPRPAVNLLNRTYERFMGGKSTFENRLFLCLAGRQDHPAPADLQMMATGTHDNLKAYATGLVWRSQERFFVSAISSAFHNYSSYFDDMIGAAQLAFLKAFPNYNPDFAPGTYFKMYVIHAAWKECIAAHETVPEHKVHIKKMIEGVVDILETEGHAVTPEAVSGMLPNISLKDIKVILGYVIQGPNISIDSLEDGGRYIENPFSPNPEEEALKGERREAFKGILNNTFNADEMEALTAYFECNRNIGKAVRSLYGHGIRTFDETNLGLLIGSAKRRLNAKFTDPEYKNNEYLKKVIDHSNLSMYSSRRDEPEVYTEKQAEEITNIWFNNMVNTIVKEEPEKEEPEQEYEQLSLFDDEVGVIA